MMKLAVVCILLAVLNLSNAGTLVLTPPEPFTISYGPFLPRVPVIVLDPIRCSTDVD